MKKFFVFLISLASIFFLANYLFVKALETVDWEVNKTKQIHSWNDKDFDILVFGNSTALDGINTEMISAAGDSAFNFSLGGASLESNYIQFKDYLDKNESPREVWLFLSSCHINYSKEMSVNPIVDYYYNKNYSMNLEDLPLFKFRWLFIENFKKLISRDHRAAKMVLGQLQINKVVPDKSKMINVRCPDYSAHSYKWLDKFASDCEGKKIVLRIFEMPCWNVKLDNCTNQKFDGRESISQIVNLNNASLVNSIVDSNTDWLSKNHLNRSGSIKLTKYILSSIDKNE